MEANFTNISQQPVPGQGFPLTTNQYAGDNGQGAMPPSYASANPQVAFAGGPVANGLMTDQGGFSPNVPRGLEYLTAVDQLLVHQKIELLEALLGCETNNKYEIKNNLGQPVYKAIEDTDCLTRQCCGPVRPFLMKITDNADNEIIHIHRPLRCMGCCFPCCLQEMDIVTSSGQVLGSVVQEWSLCTPVYTVKSDTGEPVLKIEGPCVTCRGCSDVNFDIVTLDGTNKVGKITKQWSGFLREAFTDSDHFGVVFPLDLDVKIKAVLLGAVFLIDFMYFENQGGGGIVD